MKRSGPPLRRTPLKNRRPIKRSPSVGRPHGNRSKVPNTVRENVERRARWKCEIRANGHCEDKGYHVHHVLPRSAGGTHVEENLLLCCDTCHRWVHSHPGRSYEEGWLRRRPPT